MALLHKWFPQMEDFEGQLKKYHKSIALLEAENTALADRAAAGDENRLKHRLEIGHLQSELRERQRVIDLIPPDMLKELKAAQKGKQRQERGRE